MTERETGHAENAGGRNSSRSTSRDMPMTVLTALVGIFALQAARNFIVPLLLGILITYTLYPLMNALGRLHVPRVIGAAILSIALVCSVFGGALFLRDEVGAIAEQVPTAAHRLAQALGRIGKEPAPGTAAPMKRMQEAASELEKATSQAVGGIAPKPVPQQLFRLGEWLLAGSVGIAGLISQAVVVLFLVFFLLLSGDTFKRKLVRVVGTSLWQKKNALQLLDDINTSIQRYMSMLAATNGLLALLMWGAFHLIGLQNAGAWAVFAGLLHVIPYFGPLFITVVSGLIAYLQFESIPMMLAAAGASLAIAMFVGMFVQTWMAGRIARMNAAAVFIGLLFWSWLWGAWGLLLGIPLIVILKVIAERIEGLQAIAELLGE